MFERLHPRQAPRPHLPPPPSPPPILPPPPSPHHQTPPRRRVRYAQREEKRKSGQFWLGHQGTSLINLRPRRGDVEPDGNLRGRSAPHDFAAKRERLPKKISRAQSPPDAKRNCALVEREERPGEYVRKRIMGGGGGGRGANSGGGGGGSAIKCVSWVKRSVRPPFLSRRTFFSFCAKEKENLPPPPPTFEHFLPPSL